MRTAPVRRMQRVARDVALAFLGIAGAAALWAGAAETLCTAPVDPASQPQSRFGLPATAAPGTAAEAFLSYSLRDISGSYADLAAIGPAGFPFLGAVGGHWSASCGVARAAARTGEGALARRLANAVDGFAFSAGMLARAGYERSLGAAFAAWGGDAAPEDANARAFHADHANRILSGDAGAGEAIDALVRLWRDVPFGGSARAVERRVSFSLDMILRAATAPAGLLSASLSPPSPPAMANLVVAGLPQAGTPALRQVQALGEVDGQAAALAEPAAGTQATQVVRLLADGRARLIESGGARRGLLVFRTTSSGNPSLDGAYPVFEAAAAEGGRRVGYDAEIASMTEVVRRLEAKGLRLSYASLP